MKGCVTRWSAGCTTLGRWAGVMVGRLPRRKWMRGTHIRMMTKNAAAASKVPASRLLIRVPTGYALQSPLAVGVFNHDESAVKQLIALL